MEINANSTMESPEVKQYINDHVNTLIEAYINNIYDNKNFSASDGLILNITASIIGSFVNFMLSALESFFAEEKNVSISKEEILDGIVKSLKKLWMH
jgi:hypothetical protein